MSRTHHMSVAFRLSCGCITEYTSFPNIGPRSFVLCGSCGESSLVKYRYPDSNSSCSYRTRAVGKAGKVVQVRCSLDIGHKDEKHYDDSARLSFGEPGRLRSGRQGNT